MKDYLPLIDRARVELMSQGKRPSLRRVVIKVLVYLKRYDIGTIPALAKINTRMPLGSKLEDQAQIELDKLLGETNAT